MKSGKLYIDGGLEIFTPKNDYGTAEGGEILGYSMFFFSHRRPPYSTSVTNGHR